jgi:hypothetical protein
LSRRFRQTWYRLQCTGGENSGRTNHFLAHSLALAPVKRHLRDINCRVAHHDQLALDAQENGPGRGVPGHLPCTD